MSYKNFQSTVNRPSWKQSRSRATAADFASLNEATNQLAAAQTIAIRREVADRVHQQRCERLGYDPLAKHEYNFSYLAAMKAGKAARDQKEAERRLEIRKNVGLPNYGR